MRNVAATLRYLRHLTQVWRQLETRHVTSVTHTHRRLMTTIEIINGSRFTGSIRSTKLEWQASMNCDKPTTQSFVDAVAVLGFSFWGATGVATLSSGDTQLVLSC